MKQIHETGWLQSIYFINCFICEGKVSNFNSVLLGRSCQKILSTDFFLVVTQMTSMYKMCNGAMQHYCSTAPLGGSEVSNEHVKGILSEWKLSHLFMRFMTYERSKLLVMCLIDATMMGRRVSCSCRWYVDV